MRSCPAHATKPSQEVRQFEPEPPPHRAWAHLTRSDTGRKADGLLGLAQVPQDSIQDRCRGSFHSGGLRGSPAASSERQPSQDEPKGDQRHRDTGGQAHHLCPDTIGDVSTIAHATPSLRPRCSGNISRCSLSAEYAEAYGLGGTGLFMIFPRRPAVVPSQGCHEPPPPAGGPHSTKSSDIVPGKPFV